MSFKKIELRCKIYQLRNLLLTVTLANFLSESLFALTVFIWIYDYGKKEIVIQVH